MRMNARPSLESVRMGAALILWGATPVSAMMDSQPAPRRMNALVSLESSTSLQVGMPKSGLFVPKFVLARVATNLRKGPKVLILEMIH